MKIVAFRDSTLGILAALAASCDARMEETVAEPKSEEDFVKQFSAKMEKAEADAAAGKSGKGDEGDRGTVSKGDEGADADEEDATAGGGEEEGSDDDSDEEGEGEAEQSDADADEADGDESDESDSDSGSEEDEDDESEFAKRAKDAKLPTSIDDLPKEARPLVQKRLKEMESGFTRLMQKQAEFRTEQRSFRTEERYREAHKVEWLVQEILKDPKLEEQVAAELEKLRDSDSPYIREAATVVAKDHRNKAAQDVQAEEAEERKKAVQQAADDAKAAEWVEQRGSQVATIAKKACTKFGIQFDRGVEAAIAYEISESEQGDLDDNRIREIVEEMAQERGRSTRAIKREERKRAIQGKTESARSASPIRPGQGRAGGTTSKSKTPATLEENMTAFAAKHFPGEA